jgi:urea transport system substrate-binding protein
MRPTSTVSGVASWLGFNLWKGAVGEARTTEAVRQALCGLRVKTPSGFTVMMDPSNHHLHKPAVIGRMTAGQRIVPIWTSEGLVAPEPWSPWFNPDVPKPTRAAPDFVPALALAS